MAMNKNLIIKPAPFLRRSEFDPTQRTSSHMKYVIFALIPIALFSWYKNGILPYVNVNYDLTVLQMLYPLIMILVATLSGLVFEMLYFRFFGKTKGFKAVLKKAMNSYALIPGLILGLVLPPYTPIFVAIFGAFMGTVVAKMLFGGFSFNVFNPAGVGYLLATSTYASAIRAAGGYLTPLEVDTVGTATPLDYLASQHFLGTYETLVGKFGSMWDFFVGTIPGSMGETSALLITLGFIFLVYKKVITWRIPVIYIGTTFILTWAVSLALGINDGFLGIWYPTYSILSGGLFFGAVFMATEPVTSPTSVNGQVIYAIWLGVLTTLLRFLASTPEGVMASILIMNTLIVVLDRRAAISRGNGFGKKAITNLVIMGLVIVAIVAFIIFRLNTLNAETANLLGGVLL